MTLLRDSPTGTARYQPPAEGHGQPDIFQIARPPQIAPVQGTLGPARYSVNEIPGIPGLYHWSLNWYDLRGPLVQRDRFDVNHAGWSSSTGLDARYKQVACLPLLTTTGTTPTTNANIEGTLFNARVFNQTAIGLSNLTNATGYLFTETSATNPALTAITYAPGASITNLSPVTINNVDYLAVGKTGATTELLSDLTVGGPTSAGNLDANSFSNYGIIQTALPKRPFLLHASSTMVSYPSTSIGAAVGTVTMTNIPIGGFAMGLASLAGSPVRAYWVMCEDNPASVFPGNYAGGTSISQSAFRGAIYSCNEFGFDLQRLKMPLQWVVQASLIRDGLVATDMDRVIFYNGRTQRDLRIFADPPQNSDRVYKVTGLWVQEGTELFANVNEVATANGTNTTRSSKWRYDFDLDNWQQISAWTTFTTYSGIQSFPGAGSQTGTLPISPLTGFFHERATKATGNYWMRQLQPRPGVNPYSLRKTTGATATTGVAVEASASFTSPVFDIPGLEGWPKIISRVQGPPSANILSGGTGAYITIDVGDGSAPSKFQATEPTGRYPVDEEFYNRSEVETIQITVSAFRATTGTDPTLLNINVLPIVVEGFCFKESLAIPAHWTAGQRAS